MRMPPLAPDTFTAVLKYSLEMARRAISLFEYIRNESSLPQKVRELAMLTTARATDCPYI